MIAVINNSPTAALELSSVIKKMADFKKEIVILAIGSDRATGDCLGPLVGHFLGMTGLTVYGNLKTPVNALNVKQMYEMIRQKHPKCHIIAVDSSVGQESSVGSLKVVKGGIIPAAAVGRTFPKVGDISIIAIVSPQRLGSEGLSAVKLGFVHTLAKIIAEGLTLALCPSFYKSDKKLDV